MSERGPDGGLTDHERRGVTRVLRAWHVRSRVALSAYNDATTRTVAAERRLGVPTVALSALVATGVFTTLESDPSLGWKIATGTAAVLAAVLAAVQTFLRQADRAEQFRETARGYGRVRRRIELVQLFPPATRPEANEVLSALAEELAEASRGKPNVPQIVWDRAELKVKGTSDARMLRALRLRIRERLHFGVADDAGPLPEEHERYFDMGDAIVVPLTDLRPTVRAEDEPAAVVEARRRMRRAAAGRLGRRDPLDVSPRPDGTYVILDGNATFAVAEASGWEAIPVRPVTAG